MADVQNAGAELLKNPQFMEIFQRALGGEENIKDIPPEGDPRREKWLRDIQKKIQEESMKTAKTKLEEIQSDENGQWMFILPEPGFSVKCTTAGGGKIFINVCQHERIAEPIPMDDNEGDDEIKFKIPLSCGQAKPDSDKSGKPCKVYDVIVNPSTIQRCSKDHEFRCFVISLCIYWIKQKCEPTLNTEEYRNMNFKVKGNLEPQRIRLSNLPKPSNALGDEIRLPQNNNAPSPLISVGGRNSTGKLIEEVTNTSTNDKKNSSSSNSSAPVTSKVTEKEVLNPSVKKLQGDGVYDWSKHIKPMLNPYSRESIPAYYLIEIYIPTITTIAEVEVRLTSRCIELIYVDSENGEPFLKIPMDYPIDEDAPDAKFIKKTKMLKMKLTVKLPDETNEPTTKADRDVTEIEEEEARREREKREKELLEYQQRINRQKLEEEEIMKERKSYVENLAAVQEGTMPPSLKEEVDKLSKDQLHSMLNRLELKIKKGDSIDEMLEKFPESILQAICQYIRNKLGLEQRPVNSSENKKIEENTSTDNDDGRIEYNFAKKSEKLFGVALHNRYLFALD